MVKSVADVQTMTSPTRVKVENPAKKLSNYRTPAHSSPHILSQSIHEGKAEDQVLATKVQQVQPTQQDLVADVFPQFCGNREKH